jgi:hypothetical protein
MPPIRACSTKSPTGRNILFDSEDPNELSPIIYAKQKFGRITICNSDAGGLSLANSAITEAWRTVSELEPAPMDITRPFRERPADRTEVNTKAMSFYKAVLPDNWTNLRWCPKCGSKSR